MASRQIARTNRQVYNNRMNHQSYVYGSVVTKPVYEPERRVEDPYRKRKVSQQVKKNRKKAMGMSKGYVMFLTFAAILALVVCVNYVQLQSRITNYSRNITALQQELTNMKEANTTRYNSVMDSVNLEEVRERAMNDLGMIYAASDQVIEYDSPSGDYVKQYEAIPKDGVLAQSDKNSD